jgi:hypothetical protein
MLAAGVHMPVSAPTIVPTDNVSSKASDTRKCAGIGNSKDQRRSFVDLEEIAACDAQLPARGIF